jgi:two-component system heavy metal sensor histidine kinase CusS
MSSKTPSADSGPGGIWSSLALQLTAWYTTALFLLVAAATLLLYVDLADNLRTISEQSLLDELNVCRALVLERGGDSHSLHEEVEIDSAVRRYQKFYVRVLDPSGKALSTTPGMDRDLSAARVAEAAASQQGVFRIDSPGGAHYRAIVSTVPRDASGKEQWTLQAAVDLTQEDIVLGRQRLWVALVLGAAVLICPAVGFLIAHRGTRPLREVAATAQQIGSHTLDARIHVQGYPVEVRTLADAFNSMLQRLEESFGRLSRFSADIAHELRTPVNNIRGEAEVALARERTPAEYVEVLSSCLEEGVRLSELIESLLFLARSESPGDHLKRTREDLGGLLQTIREYYDAAANEAGVKLDVESVGSVSADVDKQLLQRALSNLVSNALAHCSPKDRVSLRAFRQDSRVRIEIRDTGAGIPADALPRVFDRFYRADPARSRNAGGAGLGLAIVQQIVFLHSGTVEIASQPERGTIVSVILPGSPGAYTEPRA